MADARVMRNVRIMVDVLLEEERLDLLVYLLANANLPFEQIMEMFEKLSTRSQNHLRDLYAHFELQRSAEVHDGGVPL